MIRNYFTQSIDKKKYDLYMARNKDVYTWNLSEDMVLENCYRSTGFVVNKDMYIYYSRKNSLFSSWGIGILRKKLDNIFFL
jgi:hypothetical protein